MLLRTQTIEPIEGLLCLSFGLSPLAGAALQRRLTASSWGYGLTLKNRVLFADFSLKLREPLESPALAAGWLGRPMRSYGAGSGSASGLGYIYRIWKSARKQCSWDLACQSCLPWLASCGY